MIADLRGCEECKRIAVILKNTRDKHGTPRDHTGFVGCHACGMIYPLYGHERFLTFGGKK